MKGVLKITSEANSGFWNCLHKPMAGAQLIPAIGLWRWFWKSKRKQTLGFETAFINLWLALNWSQPYVYEGSLKIKTEANFRFGVILNPKQLLNNYHNQYCKNPQKSSRTTVALSNGSKPWYYPRYPQRCSCRPSPMIWWKARGCTPSKKYCPFIYSGLVLWDMI